MEIAYSEIHTKNANGDVRNGHFFKQNDAF